MKGKEDADSDKQKAKQGEDSKTNSTKTEQANQTESGLQNR